MSNTTNMGDRSVAKRYRGTTAISARSLKTLCTLLMMAGLILHTGCIAPKAVMRAPIPRLTPGMAAVGGAVAVSVVANQRARRAATPPPLTGGWKAGDWIPGTITLNSLDASLIMPMQIQLSAGTGGMTARNPTTGELFRGNYHGRGTPYAGRPVPADAILQGDQGSVLTVQMQIIPARSPTLPTGSGNARDNAGNLYIVKF